MKELLDIESILVIHSDVDENNSISISSQQIEIILMEVLANSNIT